MKAFTLTQPWASLIAIGAKKIETRCWSTEYRGPVPIHAAKAFPEWAKEICYEEPFATALVEGGLVHENEDRTIWTELPLGAIVAVARLSYVGEIERNEFGQTWIHGSMPVPDEERPFGDFSPGRYAWIFREVRCLPEPIPCKGSLGLWDVPADVLTQIQAQIGQEVS